MILRRTEELYYIYDYYNKLKWDDCLSHQIWLAMKIGKMKWGPNDHFFEFGGDNIRLIKEDG